MPGFLNIFGSRRRETGDKVSLEHTTRRLGELTGEEILKRGAQGETYVAFPDDTWIDVSSTAVKRTKFEPYQKTSGGGFFSRLGQRLGFDFSKNRKGIIWIQFRNGMGKSYAYPNAPFSVFETFMKSPSKGQFVHYVLKPRYGAHYRRRRRP